MNIAYIQFITIYCDHSTFEMVGLSGNMQYLLVFDCSIKYVGIIEKWIRNECNVDIQELF